MPPYDDLIREFENMRQVMRKWLEHSSQHRVSGCLSGKVCWIPSADIHEAPDAYHILVDLAGIDPTTIELVIDRNILHFNGERIRPRIDDCIRIHQMEIDFGPFRRVFKFPTEIDPDGAQSTYRHGILEIVLPKLQSPGAVQVPLRHE